MKKLCLVIIFCCIFSSFVHSNEGIQFFWSVGDVGISWNIAAEEFNPYFFVNVGNFNWITNFGLGWGFHLFDTFAGTSQQQTLILPVEIFFSPFGGMDNFLFFALYGRAGLLTTPGSRGLGELLDQSNLWGAAGIRAAWFPMVGRSWAVYLGGYIEYTTKKELRVGLSVDITVLALIWLNT